jgi:hypothetical protein
MVVKTMADWPRTTIDNYEYEGREWIHPEIPRYYLHRFPNDAKSGVWAGKWAVIDRNSDLADGDGFATKEDCIRDFVRRHDPERSY